MTEENSESPSTALAESSALPINSVGDITTIGKAVATSGMFGSCTEGKGMVIAAICHQENMSLLDFKLSYHVTDTGDVSMRSDRMLAEFQKRGGVCKWIEFSDKEARAEWTYRENENLEIGYSMKDAKAAGLTDKANWKKHPAEMLRARLISKAVRMLCPEAIAGVYTPEEIEEFAPAIDAEPTPIKTAKKVEVKVSASPAGEVESVDCTTCPIPGKMFGVAWQDMPIDHLVLAKDVKSDEMTEGHYRAIEFAIEEKGGES